MFQFSNTIIPIEKPDFLVNRTFLLGLGRESPTYY